MSYYVYFTMEAKDLDSADKASEIINWIAAKREENKDFFYPFASAIEQEDYMINGHLSLTYDEAEKWDEFHKEMMELSDAFPDVVFELHGDGEDLGDSWTIWYKNERFITHHAEIPPLSKEEWESLHEDKDMDRELGD